MAICHAQSVGSGAEGQWNEVVFSLNRSLEPSFRTSYDICRTGERFVPGGGAHDGGDADLLDGDFSWWWRCPWEMLLLGFVEPRLGFAIPMRGGGYLVAEISITTVVEVVESVQQPVSPAFVLDDVAYIVLVTFLKAVFVLLEFLRTLLQFVHSLRDPVRQLQTQLNQFDPVLRNMGRSGWPIDLSQTSRRRRSTIIQPTRTITPVSVAASCHQPEITPAVVAANAADMRLTA